MENIKKPIYEYIRTSLFNRISKITKGRNASMPIAKFKEWYMHMDIKAGRSDIMTFFY